MMTDIPFGIAEIDGEAVTIAELTFSEIAAFTTFIPNHDLIFTLIRSLDFSGRVPPVVAESEREAALMENSMEGDYMPTEEEVGIAGEVFSKWFSGVAPDGLRSLAEKGLLIPSEDGLFKTHRSLDNILKILKFPVEHMSYRTSQTQINEPSSSPILRSSLYAVQSFSGDWLIAEHFQSHDHVRFVCVPGGSNLAKRVESIITSGVERSITDTLVSDTGVEYRPFGVIIARSNEHGANVIASAQLLEEEGEVHWYSPYESDKGNKLLGKSLNKFGNLFATDPGVAEMASAPYTQLDIRNGLEGWSLIGKTEELVSEVAKIMHLPLHSQSDHLPDTIPEFFFDKNKDD